MTVAVLVVLGAVATGGGRLVVLVAAERLILGTLASGLWAASCVGVVLLLRR
jgi:hypothetical protein